MVINLLNNEVSSSKMLANTISKCILCKKPITENDLIHISRKGQKDFLVHFKCYIEIQEKICVECGYPFKDQEQLLFCEEHNEYFHDLKKCSDNHLRKHKYFKKAIYDGLKNRISLL